MELNDSPVTMRTHKASSLKRLALVNIWQGKAERSRSAVSTDGDDLLCLILGKAGTSGPISHSFFSVAFVGLLEAYCPSHCF